MSAEWYVRVMGTELGPMPARKLRQMALQRQLSPDDLIRNGEDGQWMTADRAEGLFAPPERIRACKAPLSSSKKPVKAPEPAPKPPRLIPCPKCGKWIPESSEACISCGHRLVTVNPLASPPAGPRRENPNSSWRFKLYLILAGVTFVVFYQLAFVDDSPRGRRSSASGQRWFEGGTLHDKTALDWQQASARDKLATCADFVASVPEIRDNISDMDDLKPYAQKLVRFIDDAYERHPDPDVNRRAFTNQPVTLAVAVAFRSWGWEIE